MSKEHAKAPLLEKADVTSLPASPLKSIICINISCVFLTCLGAFFKMASQNGVTVGDY